MANVITPELLRVWGRQAPAYIWANLGAGAITQQQALDAAYAYYASIGDPDPSGKAQILITRGPAGVQAGGTPEAPPSTRASPVYTGTPAQKFAQETGEFEGTYEQFLGLPPVGRSPYERWLGGKSRENALAYALAGAPEFLGASPQPISSVTGEPATFLEWLTGRGMGRIAEPQAALADLYQRFSGFSPTTQRTITERFGGGLPEDLFGAALSRRYALPFAQGIREQAFAPAAQRAFEISPQGGAQLGGPTFLDFIRRRYGL